MNTATALWLLLIVAILAIAKAGGANSTALFAFTFTAALIGISWFFSARRASPATVLEKIAATTWLVIRRLVGIIGAILFLVAGVALASNSFEAAAKLSDLGYAIFSFMLSGFCLWVAIYGQGWNRFDWKDDVELHRKNKKRYRWRW
jgi:hypothetical protein